MACDDFSGFCGGDVTDSFSVLAPADSSEIPRPLLEPGRLGLEASRPADLMAASSSFLDGS